MAVIDGIQNKIDPGEPLDAKDSSAAADSLGPKTPSTLEAALIALEDDSEFLMRGDVFSEEILSTWIQSKRGAEIGPMRSRPHPFEYCLYYDV
jgi:glutamine synthetase